MTEPNIHPPQFISYLRQSQSSLFSALPPEIRYEIFAFALAEFEDTDRPYDRKTYWTRPGYSAPHRTCTELLRTCKRVYLEAWFMPFAYAEHAFYFTSAERRPGGMYPEEFQRCLDLIYHTHGKIEAGRIRIFAQLWALEKGDHMVNLLDLNHFFPKSITLTIRYTDFWWWESNHPLFIDATWVNIIRFPESVTRFTMDFESIEHRKGEIDYIANKAAEKWFFRRKDGKFLTADKSDMSVSKWTGSSVLGGMRWLRDEARPGQLDYHIATVVWRVSPTLTEPPLRTPCRKLQVPRDFPQILPPSRHLPSVSVEYLREARIGPDLPAEVIWEELDLYYELGIGH